ncbi:MAG: acyltransferase family protein [Spirosomataceae bacterium]
MGIDRLNNLDLVRLFASAQVLVWHVLVHLDLFNPDSFFLKFLYNIPGVPIFFAISGFLITSSIDKTNFIVANYVRSRFMRLFPALVICLLFTSFLVYWSGTSIDLSDWLIYFFTHLTIFQSWISEGLRVWGVGHPNGSLWSISVEIQLYCLLPFLVISLKNKKIEKKNFILFLLFISSIAYRFIIDEYIRSKSETIAQFGSMFLFHHFQFFALGIALYYNFNQILPFLESRVLKWLGIYAAYVLVCKYYFEAYETPYSYSFFGIVANILLIGMVFSFAFSNKEWSSMLLRQQDISYGLYIFHMPIVNFFVQKGLVGDIVYFFLVCLFSFILAVLSWIFIERKALQFK